jgi:hypothetical protein
MNIDAVLRSFNHALLVCVTAGSIWGCGSDVTVRPRSS